MNHSCHTLLKSKVRDLLIFTSESLFHSQNMSNSLKNIYIFLYFFYAQNKSLLSLFTKEWLSLFTKEQCESFALFDKWMFFCSFTHKKRTICSKYHEWIPNPGFWTKSKKFGISPIVPMANNMQMHKIWKSLKLTHPIVSVLFT